MLRRRSASTVTGYSPSDGHTCERASPACAKRQSSCGSPARCLPSCVHHQDPDPRDSRCASRAIFCEAFTYSSTSVDETPSAPAMLSKPAVESSTADTSPRRFRESAGRESRWRTRCGSTVQSRRRARTPRRCDPARFPERRNVCVEQRRHQGASFRMAASVPRAPAHDQLPRLSIAIDVRRIECVNLQLPRGIDSCFGSRLFVAADAPRLEERALSVRGDRRCGRSGLTNLDRRCGGRLGGNGRLLRGGRWRLRSGRLGAHRKHPCEHRERADNQGPDFIKSAPH